MKSVELYASVAIIPAGFGSLLSESFGPVTERPGKWYITNDNGIMKRHEIAIFEFAYPRADLDPLSAFIQSLPEDFRDTLEVRVSGEKFFTGSAVGETEKPKIRSAWPRTFDVAVQTVIGKELAAAQDAFQSDPFDALSIDGTIFYRGSFQQRDSSLDVVICAQNAAGNSTASMFAERLINHWSPTTIFLMGIAAGRRNKCRIGDVVTPRVVVNDLEGVMEASIRLKRPRIFPPPFSMVQQLQNFRFDRARKKWHDLLHSMTPPPSDASHDVALNPDMHAAAIYSSDLLLRDGEYLEDATQMHQQIRIGEMEAAGFAEACNDRTTPVPWFIVRSVSDFGDTNKNDAFQTWAAYSAAAYLRVLVEQGINFALFSKQ